MDFLKELFGDKPLTFDQLQEAAKAKGFNVVNAAGGAYVPKADVDHLNGQISSITAQLGEANKKLEGYDPNWKQTAEAANAKLQKERMEFALEKGIAEAKPRNTRAVIALLDREKLKYADGEIIGLDKQLKELKENEDTAFLFEDTQPVKTGVSHQHGQEGAPDKKDAANNALRAIFKGGN
mgnify:CR=1 FL=1